MKNTIKLSIAAILAVSNIYALEDLGMITVTGGNFTTKENRTTFATEIFTQNEIKNSNASTIYEFLNEQSSINVMPSSGNIYAQKIDMRGFGITDGYQNVVVIVDGQRLNNIDMTTQLLSSIPVDTIEQIEIIKGSGSVKYGDGATAGAINIITNGKYNNKLSMFSGNNGTKGASIILGYNT
ncbi:MAG: Plug domain-containing protein, partial [Campylobacterales bacterium]|nr:Plug domain-containing protein [Campylobacterales bacterium]